MSSTLTILGCGYIGSALAEVALEKNWTVSALTRNEETGKNLERMGVQDVVISRLDSDEWHSYLDPNQDFVVNCVGAFSPSLDGYVTSYVEGQKSAMKWIEAGKVNSYLFTSSCSVYPQTGRKLVEETASCAGVSEKGGLLLAAEGLSFPPPSSIGRSFVLRLGGIYGPGRHLLANKVKNGVAMDGNAGRILNLIHRDDAVSAILACLLADESNLGRLYNLTDSSPSARGEIVEWLANKFEVSPPSFSEDDKEDTPNRKISSQRIMKELNWSPKYPSFIQGYESLLG
jgi:nucleoside-diphosphate-sugar epimerase